MKKLALGTSLVLATLTASPVFAATPHLRNSAANVAYASENARTATTEGYYGESPAVIFENKVVGQDPDPNVRLNLARDPGLLAN
jgi:hypothetical protein